MTDQPDRIRVWNEDDKKMFEPETIYEMLRGEHNNGIEEGEAGLDQYPVDSDEYGHLGFMRNTGIYSEIRAGGVHQTGEEIFAEDLITHSIEPYVYRVMQKHGCWRAISLSPDAVMSRCLNEIFHPAIVGNVFENRELFEKGEIIDD